MGCCWCPVPSPSDPPEFAAKVDSSRMLLDSQLKRPALSSLYVVAWLPSGTTQKVRGELMCPEAVSTKAEWESVIGAATFPPPGRCLSVMLTAAQDQRGLCTAGASSLHSLALAVCFPWLAFPVSTLELPGFASQINDLNPSPYLKNLLFWEPKLMLHYVLICDSKYIMVKVF